MGSAYLKTLGITVQLEDRLVYHDDGFVNDVYEHMRKLDRIYEGYTPPNPEGKPIGKCVARPDRENRVHIHIFLERSRFRYRNIFWAGHEETHALQCMGALNLLVGAINSNKLSVELIFELGGDMAANIGGTYALRRAGFNRFLENLLYIELGPDYGKVRQILG